jgi:class 3 adenylate cyclase
MKYAIIGDTVNLAARLEGLNATLGTDILVSEEVRTQLPPDLAARCVARGEHLVKGRLQPVKVHSI